MTNTHSFVDEAGDTTLFGQYGQVLVGTPDASRYFIVGRLEVDDIASLEADIVKLRAELLADPLLQGVPSMRPEKKKTAISFHAKNDVPEVRHAVFKLLLKHDLRMSAVVRDKRVLLEQVQRRQVEDPTYRNKSAGHVIYVELIASLFARVGQFGGKREITFAVRGSKPRTAVLQQVLDGIDKAFVRDFGFAPHGHTRVHSELSVKSGGLQACDYLLWALQRFYGRGEDRYLTAMWSKFVRVVDLDLPAPKSPGRKRAAPAATEFNEKNPLTLDSRTGVGIGFREI